MDQKQISRREVLKTLAAAGGALAASSLLPGKWSKPVIEGGVLPAHAQASRCGTVTILTGGLCAVTQICPPGWDAYVVLSTSPALPVVDVQFILCGTVLDSAFEYNAQTQQTILYIDMISSEVEQKLCGDGTITFELRAYLQSGCYASLSETVEPGRKIKKLPFLP